MGHSDQVRSRAAGCLLGLAIGDALGAALEFTQRDSRPLLTEMVGGGPFDLPPGAWTDDTSMALCLADSLIACGDLVDDDVMQRFVRWWLSAENSSTGTCSDIGTTTRDALERYRTTGNPVAGSSAPRTAGNGSLMRLAPVAIGAGTLKCATDWARRQSSFTHAAPEAIEACALYADLLHRAIAGEPREHVLAVRDWRGEPAIAAIAAGSWKIKSRQAIRSTGYVLDTLEAALWAIGGAISFENALVRAVNLADDADTVGAVTGQLAGALWSAAEIPHRWLQPLVRRQAIEAMVEPLLAIRDRAEIDLTPPPPI